MDQQAILHQHACFDSRLLWDQQPHPIKRGVALVVM